MVDGKKQEEKKMMVNALTILLVEDNPDHVFLTLEGLKRGNLVNDVRVANDGQEALDYVYRKGKYADEEKYPLPELILLDIRLPKKNGIEVLKIIKEDDKLKDIPVIMLTTSVNEDEIAQSYSYGANSYITKPVTFHDFVEKMKALQFYWCVTNTLPPPHNEAR
jgi:CheY-like chemotaxis protein